MAGQEASRAPIVAVGGDLMARARLESAARDAGRELAPVTPQALETTLERQPASMVVIDLDDHGNEALAALVRARSRGLSPPRVVGYFSHVDVSLGQAARAAGCEALPRGRFWRDLSAILRAGL